MDLSNYYMDYWEFQLDYDNILKMQAITMFHISLHT